MPRANDAQRFYLIGQYYGDDMRTFENKNYYSLSILQPQMRTLASYSLKDGVLDKLADDGIDLQINDLIACMVTIETSVYDGKSRTKKTITSIRPLKEWLESMALKSPEDFL